MLRQRTVQSLRASDKNTLDVWIAQLLNPTPANVEGVPDGQQPQTVVKQLTYNMTLTGRTRTIAVYRFNSTSAPIILAAATTHPVTGSAVLGYLSTPTPSEYLESNYVLARPRAGIMALRADTVSIGATVLNGKLTAGTIRVPICTSAYDPAAISSLDPNALEAVPGAVGVVARRVPMGHDRFTYPHFSTTTTAVPTDTPNYQSVGDFMDTFTYKNGTAVGNGTVWPLGTTSPSGSTFFRLVGTGIADGQFMRCDAPAIKFTGTVNFIASGASDWHGATVNFYYLNSSGVLTLDEAFATVSGPTTASGTHGHFSFNIYKLCPRPIADITMTIAAGAGTVMLDNSLNFTSIINIEYCGVQDFCPTQIVDLSGVDTTQQATLVGTLYYEAQPNAQLSKQLPMVFERKDYLRLGAYTAANESLLGATALFMARGDMSNAVADLASQPEAVVTAAEATTLKAGIGDWLSNAASKIAGAAVNGMSTYIATGNPIAGLASGGMSLLAADAPAGHRTQDVPTLASKVPNRLLCADAKPVEPNETEAYKAACFVWIDVTQADIAGAMELPITCFPALHGWRNVLVVHPNDLETVVRYAAMAQEDPQFLALDDAACRDFLAECRIAQATPLLASKLPRELLCSMRQTKPTAEKDMRAETKPRLAAIGMGDDVSEFEDTMPAQPTYHTTMAGVVALYLWTNPSDDEIAQVCAHDPPGFSTWYQGRRCAGFPPSILAWVLTFPDVEYIPFPTATDARVQSRPGRAARLHLRASDPAPMMRVQDVPALGVSAVGKGTIPISSLPNLEAVTGPIGGPDHAACVRMVCIEPTQKDVLLTLVVLTAKPLEHLLYEADPENGGIHFAYWMDGSERIENMPNPSDRRLAAAIIAEAWGAVKDASPAYIYIGGDDGGKPVPRVTVTESSFSLPLAIAAQGITGWPLVIGGYKPGTGMYSVGNEKEKFAFAANPRVATSAGRVNFIASVKGEPLPFETALTATDAVREQTSAKFPGGFVPIESLATALLLVNAICHTPRKGKARVSQADKKAYLATHPKAKPQDVFLDDKVKSFAGRVRSGRSSVERPQRASSVLANAPASTLDGVVAALVASNSALAQSVADALTDRAPQMYAMRQARRAQRVRTAQPLNPVPPPMTDARPRPAKAPAKRTPPAQFTAVPPPPALTYVPRAAPKQQPVNPSVAGLAPGKGSRRARRDAAVGAPTRYDVTLADGSVVVADPDGTTVERARYRAMASGRQVY